MKLGGIRIGMMIVAMIVLLTGGSVGFCNQPVLMLATTTSTDNTGLLDYLAPVFTRETGIALKWTAVGTGKALALGKNCDVDVLMVHAPEAEQKFVKNGFGVNRRQIMYNDFILIGPESDPARIAGKNVVAALNAIAAQGARFLSRGDNSGTHKKERKLWKATGLPLPEQQNWYLQTGQGMLATIQIAMEKRGYTFTDRGTYIKYASNQGGNPPLKIMVQNDPSLLNQYSVMAVNKSRCRTARYDLAMRFCNWLVSLRTQKRIANFRLLGNPLFTPNAK